MKNIIEILRQVCSLMFLLVLMLPTF